MARRLLAPVARAAFTLWLVGTAAFFALRVLPGDAIDGLLLGSGAGAVAIAERRAALGLDRPLIEQYAAYCAGVARGDLGVSLIDGVPVRDAIAARLPATLELAAAALAVAIAVGLGLGIAEVIGRGVIRIGARVLLEGALGVPVAFTGTVAIGVFAVALGWLPAGGARGVEALILPAVVLGFHTAGAIGRVTAAALHESIAQDYTRTASAKGLRRWRIVIRHGLQPAATPVVAAIGVQAGFLIGGAVVTETVFTRVGLGAALVSAVLRQDYPLVQGITLVTAAGVVMVQAVAGAIAAALDPRARLDR